MSTPTHYLLAFFKTAFPTTTTSMEHLNTVSVTRWPSFGLCVKQASLFFSPCLVVETRAPPTSTMMPYAQFFATLEIILSTLSIFFNRVSHYSKSQIFVQKFNFEQTPTFSRVFHPKIFLTIFLVESKLSTAKSPKPQHFHEFSPKANLQFFSGNQSWIFGQKIKIVRI